MNQEENIRNRIEAYLNHELSDSERQEFEQELVDNHELKSKFEELKPAYQLLKLYRRSQLQEELGRIAKRPPIYIEDEFNKIDISNSC